MAVHRITTVGADNWLVTFLTVTLLAANSPLVDDRHREDRRIPAIQRCGRTDTGNRQIGAGATAPAAASAEQHRKANVASAARLRIVIYSFLEFDHCRADVQEAADPRR